MTPVNILVVDDEEIIVTLLEAFLKKFSCRISKATNASEAIHLIENQMFSLVITDLQLGESNGLEVVRKTKELSPQTLVFMMTGCNELEQVIAAFRHGVDDFLLKPFSMLFLLERLKEKGLSLNQLTKEIAAPEKPRRSTTCQSYLHSVKENVYG